MIADLYKVSLDEIIKAGNPSTGEALILKNIALGDMDYKENSVNDLINLAPYLKASILEDLSKKLDINGINISGIVELAKYLNDKNFIDMLEKVECIEKIDFMEKLIPVLSNDSLENVFARILEGRVDYYLIKTLKIYAPYLTSQIEAAVIEGILPREVLYY